jgi:S-layer homology domain
MTQSPTPDPNNRRRRRLTADELIAVLVAMAGIGSIFWWSVSHRTTGWNFAQTNNGEAVRTTLPLSATGTTPDQKQLPSNKVVVAEPSDSHVIMATPTVQPSANSAVNPAIVGIAAATSAIAGLSQPQGASESTPSSPLVAASPLPKSTAPAFKDVEAHWAKDYIAVLRERQVLDDFGTGTFDPNLPVTRGEYAKMLDRAFPERVVTQQVLEFKDIPATYKRREALDKSVKMGFMTGYSKTKFAPEEKIPRYQMQISLAKGLGLKIPSNVEKILAKYPDAGKMPKYARDKMAAAIQSGLVVKDKNANLLQPTNATTRGEAAALIYEVLVKEGKVSPAKAK